MPPRNVEDLRSPVDWLTDMSLISAGGMAETDGYIGYMKAYATAHEALDEDKAFQEEELAISHLGQICLSFSDSDPKIIRTLIPRFDMALVKTSRIAGSAAKTRRLDVSPPAPLRVPKTRALKPGKGLSTDKVSERVAAATEELASGLTQASAAAEELRRSMEQIATGADEAAGGVSRAVGGDQAGHGEPDHSQRRSR
ncbi:hypothetical protein SAMN05443248_4429 [Bradyrhizobium erythrophlei]|uniref:Uncharacterized protein n=2 Tax=Bradyrhizobium erythrophlei TaxID=1437360 RepID=A0A1M5RZJ9_9BRAD|nr:hypothetical protein SAMN05443248_4429 [Bradyrhizobium erythrophlei]